MPGMSVGESAVHDTVCPLPHEYNLSLRVRSTPKYSRTLFFQSRYATSSNDRKQTMGARLRRARRHGALFGLKIPNRSGWKATEPSTEHIWKAQTIAVKSIRREPVAEREHYGLIKVKGSDVKSKTVMTQMTSSRRLLR